MIFPSLSYFYVCVGLFALYCATPKALHKYVLLAANVFFAVAFGLETVVALVYTTLICAAGNRLLPRRQGKVLYIVLLGLCLLPFAAIKLIFPASSWTAQIFRGFLPIIGRLSMPIGVSYFTIRALLYLREVRKRAAGYSSLGLVNYLFFFPQFVSGPIQQPEELLPQLLVPQGLDSQLAITGAGRILYGLALKFVVADYFALFQQGVDGMPITNSLSMVFIMLCFGMQLYCDFSGYSQMAIGIANLFGYRCAENFISPYLSQSVGEFWRRWHISLSTALRQLVYIPMGGSRHKTLRWIAAISATFLASGLWHGTGVIFLIWGGWHAFCIVAGRLTLPLRKKVHGLLRLKEGSRALSLWQKVVTFTLVTIGWIPFKIGISWGGSPKSLVGVLETLGRPVDFSMHYLKDSFSILGFDEKKLFFALIFFALVLLMDILTRKEGFGRWFSQKKGWQQGAFAVVCLAAVLFFEQVGGGSFLYFTF